MFLESKLEESKWTKTDCGATAGKPFYVNTSKLEKTDKSDNKSIRNAEVDLFTREMMEQSRQQESLMVNEPSTMALPAKESSQLDPPGVVNINELIKYSKAVTIEDHGGSQIVDDDNQNLGSPVDQSLAKFPEQNVSEMKINGFASGTNQGYQEASDKPNSPQKVYFKTLEEKQAFASQAKGKRMKVKEKLDKIR